MVTGKGQGFVLKNIADLKLVAMLTGKDSINSTDKYGIYGTDLGSIFEHKGNMYMVFGDTFGVREESHTGAGGENWRCNVMAQLSCGDFRKGLIINRMITDENGIAKELLRGKKINDDEMTIIPAYACSANGNMYLYYMSVKKWDPNGAGRWICNYGGLAKSTDDGNNFTMDEQLRWDGDSNFIQASICRIKDELYFWCIPAGRHGAVKLMKVKEKDIDNKEAFVYFTGVEKGEPVWSFLESNAAEVIKGPVGEFSVAWNNFLNRWILLCLNIETHTIDIRESMTPWGPWSEPKVMLSTVKDYPKSYGPFTHSKFFENDGEIIYFTLSRWDQYNVYWFSARLLKD